MNAAPLAGRTVTVVLCTADGDVLGCLPPVRTPTPWWPESHDVVSAVAAAHNLRITLLRLLSTSGPEPGGAVAYLAELDDRESPARLSLLRGDLQPWTGPDPLAEHPLRMPWARPGGPRAELAWADAALRAAGRPRTGDAVQTRTWNLSAIWRLPTDGGDVWLKCVPPFFAHEGALIGRLARLAGAALDAVAPPLIAHGGHRVLLADIPGEDQYDAAPDVVLSMISMLVGLQSALADDAVIDELLAMGLPDWRRDPLHAAAHRVVERYGGGLEPAQRGAVEAILDAWDERYTMIASCGVPNTLVHGDFHSGNVRGAPPRLTILDWGDSGVGHPLLDQPAMLDGVPQSARERVAGRWAALWRDAAPGSDPQRAAQLLRPIAALRQACIYTGFLDAIEPDERVYHASDPLTWLRRAASGG